MWYCVPFLAFVPLELFWLLKVGLSKPSLIHQRSPAVMNWASVITSIDWQTGSRPVGIQDRGQGVRAGLVMGAGQPWEIGGRNLEPQRLGMLSEKVSAKGSRVRPRQRWVGVSKNRDGVLRELGCWARYRDRLQPLESNSKNWVKMIPLLIRPAEKMEVLHMLCHKTEPGAQYFMFPYSGM